MNLQGSHQCLEVLVLQNYQENPEKRRQTRMSVIEAPWCRQLQTAPLGPCAALWKAVGHRDVWDNQPACPHPNHSCHTSTAQQGQNP